MGGSYKITTRRQMALYPSPAVVHAIIHDAVRAPSAGNCQPWRFDFHRDTLTIFHQASRGQSHSNRANHASLLALGCVLESIRLSANHHRFTAHWTLPRR